MSQAKQEQWTKQELLKVAKYQKNILWMILISMVAMFIPYGIIVTGIIFAYFIYKLAVALRLSYPWIYIILIFIPYVNWIALLVLNSKATKKLKAHGIRVGLMGAKMADFDKIPDNLGSTYFGPGRPTEAVEDYKEDIRIKPDGAEAYYNQGVAYGKLGRFEEAIEAYKKAIRIKPDYAEAHKNMGAIYLVLDRYTEAIEAYKQAIRIKPDDAGAHVGLILSYGALGDWGSAIEEYKILKDLDNDLANKLLGKNYIKKTESSSFELFLKGLPFVLAGKYKIALSYFEEAVKKDPYFAYAYFQIGICNGELGRYTEAIEAYKQVIRIMPDYAEAHYMLGGAYFKLGRYTEAIEALKEAIRIKPDFAGAHFGLGLAYMKFGDRGSALKEYKILKDLDSDLANKLFNMIHE